MHLQVVESFCEWQGALKELFLLKEELVRILKHSIDDKTLLEQALTLEERVYSKHLLQIRIGELEDRISLIKALPYIDKSFN
jgi:hypothetical protein